MRIHHNLFTRGGVEDTRLEAKAKDTKKSEAKAKDSLSEDRHSRGQGQECSRPRPRTKDKSASALQKKGLHKNFSGDLKKKGLPKFFRRSPQKTVFQKIFSGAPQNFYNSKTKCCPRAEDRPIFEDLRPRGQGQGLQNVSSRTPPLLFTHTVLQYSCSAP